MEYEVKKLFNGFASLRETTVNTAIKQRQDIIITYKGKTMRVPLDRLKGKWGMHKKEFKSKFGTKPYKLYDFRFEADSDQQEKQDNQPTLL